MRRGHIGVLALAALVTAVAATAASGSRNASTGVWNGTVRVLTAQGPADPNAQYYYRMRTEVTVTVKNAPWSSFESQDGFGWSLGANSRGATAPGVAWTMTSTTEKHVLTYSECGRGSGDTDVSWIGSGRGTGRLVVAWEDGAKGGYHFELTGDSGSSKTHFSGECDYPASDQSDTYDASNPFSETMVPAPADTGPPACILSGTSTENSSDASQSGTYTVEWHLERTPCAAPATDKPAQPTNARSFAVKVSGPGTVTASPKACAISCKLPEGSKVTLIAKAKPGAVFAGWSGSCRGKRPTCRVTLVRAAAATARFVKR